MGPNDLAIGVVDVICWVMSLYKLRDLLRDRTNQPLRYLWLALITITLSLTVQVTALDIDRLAGVLNLSRISSNCLTLVAAATSQGFLVFMTSSDSVARRRVHLRILTMVVCVVVMIALFIPTPSQYSVTDPYVRSGEYYATTPTLTAAPYMLVYLAYLGWAMAQVAVLATRYARIANRPLLRLGLRLITTGAVFGLAYIVAKILAVIAVTLHQPWYSKFDAVVVLCFSSSILLILLGSTLPSWGPLVGLAWLWKWSSAMRTVRRLSPLWNELYSVVPQIALEPPVPGLKGWWHNARHAWMRQMRTTVEILDGCVLMGPWMSATAADAARAAAQRRGLTGEEGEITVEAAVLAVAVRARRSGHDQPTTTWSPPRPPSDLTAGDEAQRLCQVSHALRRSPVVTETLAEVTTGSSTPTATAAE